MHALDFAVLYRHRPLWDAVALVLLLGVGASSITSIVPAFRRLARHGRRFVALTPAAAVVSRVPAPVSASGAAEVAQLARRDETP